MQGSLGKCPESSVKFSMGLNMNSVGIPGEFRASARFLTKIWVGAVRGNLASREAFVESSTVWGNLIVQRCHPSDSCPQKNPRCARRTHPTTKSQSDLHPSHAGMPPTPRSSWRQLRQCSYKLPYGTVSGGTS